MIRLAAIIALLPSLALAQQPVRLLPARLHGVGLVLRAPCGGAGRDLAPTERHLPLGLDPQRQLLPAQRQRALTRGAARGHTKRSRGTEKGHPLVAARIIKSRTARPSPGGTERAFSTSAGNDRAERALLGIAAQVDTALSSPAPRASTAVLTSLSSLAEHCRAASTYQEPRFRRYHTGKFPAGDIGLIFVPVNHVAKKGTPQGRGVNANHPEA